MNNSPKKPPFLDRPGMNPGKSYKEYLEESKRNKLEKHKEFIHNKIKNERKTIKIGSNIGLDLSK